jgi:hypothetical protein
MKNLTPEAYIKSKARSLPIGECLINSGWNENGLATILIVRNHPKGTFTFGFYLVDLYAFGVKDSLFKFNVDQEYLEDFIEKCSPQEMIKIDYNLAHNIIYGAQAFASENGFKELKDFKLSKFILEEDDDTIPLIELEFGEEGQLSIYDTGVYDLKDLLPD